MPNYEKFTQAAAERRRARDRIVEAEPEKGSPLERVAVFIFACLFGWFVAAVLAYAAAWMTLKVIGLF